MDYIEIVGKDYEDALAKAKNELGEDFGVLSMKETSQNSFIGLGKTKKCILTCFVKEPDKETSEVPEEEQKDEVSVPDSVTIAEETVISEDQPVQKKSCDPLKPEKVKSLTDYARRILNENEFSAQFSERIIHNLEMQLTTSLSAVPTEKEIEVSLIDLIFSSFSIDRQTQLQMPKFFEVVGLSDVGKTSVIAKIASLFNDKTVAVISLDDSSKTVSLHEKAAKALGYRFYQTSNSDSLSQAIDKTADCDLVFVDTPPYPLKSEKADFATQGRLAAFAQKDCGLFLVVPAYMKESDYKIVFDLYSCFDINGVIVTKMDETVTIGPLLSVLSEREKSIVFISDGKKIPSNIHGASTAYLLSCLKGFTLDLSKITG